MLNWLFGSGIGTNLGASLIWAAIVGCIGALIWPPTRRALHRFVDRKLNGIKNPLLSHIQRQNEHNEWVARHVARMHESATGRPADPHPHFDLDT